MLRVPHPALPQQSTEGNEQAPLQASLPIGQYPQTAMLCLSYTHQALTHVQQCSCVEQVQLVGQRRQASGSRM